MKLLLCLISVFGLIGLPSYSTAGNYFKKGEELFKELAVQKRPSYEKFRLAASGGWSRRLAKTADGISGDYKNYINGLKSGYHYGIEAGYFWEEEAGAGLRLDRFSASNSAYGTFNFDDGSTELGTMKDDIQINFIAPVFYSRHYTRNRKTIFNLNAAIGYMSYENNSKVIDETFKITGKTVGFSIGGGADFKLGKNLAFGLGVGFTGGSLKKVEYDNGTTKQTRELEEGNYESLVRLDVSAGLRLFW